MTGFEQLRVPPSFRSADDVVSIVDRCLAAGFARLGPTLRADLEPLSRCFASTPLAAAVADAVAAIGGGHVTEDALVALAAARESVLGACHDALFVEANRALGDVWAAPTDKSEPAPARGDDAAALTSGLRQWLVEVALAGLAQLETSTVAPFVGAVDEIQSEPELVRVAALVTGFVDELLEHTPTAGLAELPIRRWADLWARCMVAGKVAPRLTAAEDVSGELRVFGATVHEHDHVASLVAFGALDSRVVRTTITAWKVDAVTGAELWSLFDAVAPELVSAIAEHKSVAIESASLTGTGDLRWPDDAELAGKFDPLAVAGELLAPGSRTAVPTVAPDLRHPVQLSLPVLLGGGDDIALAEDWIPGDQLDAARRREPGIGLLRFDGGSWMVQPIFAAPTGKKKPKNAFGYREAIAAARKIKKSASTIAVLKERASKLLRA